MDSTMSPSNTQPVRQLIGCARPMQLAISVGDGQSNFPVMEESCRVGGVAVATRGSGSGSRHVRRVGWLGH